MNLQRYLGISPTGYFGPITANAVAKFQASEGLSQVGFVGPQTRAAFARRCGYIHADSPLKIFSASPMRGVAPLSVDFTFAPKTDDVGQYYVAFGDGEGQLMKTQQIYCITTPCISPSVASHTYAKAGIYTASVSHYIACLHNDSDVRCMVAEPAPLAYVMVTVTDGSTTTGTPSISGVEGPTTLKVGQSGTWSVKVKDVSGYLSYSVRWGDEVTPFDRTAVMAPWTPNSNSGTFTHTYTTSGTYSPTFTVTNANGQSASASVTVVVGESTNSGTLSVSPTAGSAPLSVSVTFPSEWRSLVAGECQNNQPRFGGRSFSINWGDGTYPNQNGRNTPCGTHTYTVPGTYTITGKIYDFSDVPVYNGDFTRDVWVGTATITVR